MKTRVWLIRHGEPVAEAQQRCYGSLNVGLSQRGRSQIGRVTEYLKGEALTAVYTSPLCRASESAGMIAAACVCMCENVDGFREIHFGDFEGLTYDEIALRYPDIYRHWMEQPTAVLFPNGESLGMMRSRVLKAFDDVVRKHAGESIAMVSHGGVIRILIAWVLQIPDECFFRVAQQHGAINLVSWSDGVPSVELLNLSFGGGESLRE